MGRGAAPGVGDAPGPAAAVGAGALQPAWEGAPDPLQITQDGPPGPALGQCLDELAWCMGALGEHLDDALGRRIGKTVDGTTTFYLPAGAQTVVEIDRPALPQSQADVDGAQADGALANLSEAPASGGILPGAAGTVTRINFQPATTATPAGFIRDTGKAAAVRTNGLTYGWSADSSAQAVVRGGAVPLMEFDTFIQAQTDTASASWSIALPNGTYPVVVVAGDALSTEQTNHLLIGGVFREDLTPSVLPGYQAGNFDGYALEVTVTDGTLTIAPSSGAYHAKLCFVEIGEAGAPGTLITPEITATLVARIAQANAQTGANPIVRNGQREYIYGSYVDEVLCYQATAGIVTERYFPHYNHLYSVAALTNAVGDVVERYTYTAYGKQTRTVMPGKVGTAFGRGFTGYIADQETGLLHARARQYSPTLGLFVGRDGNGYVDGFGLYGAYYVSLGSVDPLGGWTIDLTTNTITIEPGDTLWKIAAELTGNGTNYKDLFPDPDSPIVPGQKIKMKTSGKIKAWSETKWKKYVTNPQWSDPPSDGSGTSGTGDAASGTPPPPPPGSPSYIMKGATITYYCSCSECCRKSPDDPAYGVCADGTRACEGTVAGPPGIKFGTSISFTHGGETFSGVVHDRGGKIKGKRFDIWCASHKEGIEKGTFVTDVTVTPP